MDFFKKWLQQSNALAIYSITASLITYLLKCADVKKKNDPRRIMTKGPF